MTSYRVILFARYAELFGNAEVSVELPAGARVTDLIAALRDVPGGDSLPEHPFVAVNQERSDESRMLMAGDELALLPPLAGG